MHIYYLKYNNYYNRKFKREASLPDYLVYEVARTENLALWNPADGVETSIVANIDIPFGAAQPDYAVLQGDTVDDYINSRWFIMEMVQLRKGQYRVSLRRDIIVDSIEVLENTTNFLAERGFVEQNNKLALQPENITVNRIKTKETPIKDETGVPWIVGYLNRSYEGGKIEGNMEITPMAVYTTMEEFPYQQYRTNWFNGYTSDDSAWFTLYWSKNAYLNKWVRSWDIKKNSITQNSDWKSNIFLGYRKLTGGADGEFPTLDEIKSTFSTNTWIADVKNNFGIKTKAETDAFLAFEDAKIQIADKYYTVRFTKETYNYEETLNKTEATNEALTIKSLCEGLGGSLSQTNPDAPVYTFHTSGLRYKITLEELNTGAGFSVTIPAISSRPHLDDAPYDMFMIPYGEYNGYGSQRVAEKTASTIMTKLNVGASSNLYDIQLLPFAPQLTTTITDIKNASNEVIGKMYWSSTSTIEKTILLYDAALPENKKLDSIINLYRLVSPNYSGQFEFTAAANDSIYGFNVSATYMPYNPYIRVAPIFGGLYGKDYGDARGLICGGDFSLPAANDAWVSYQQNNKNYNAIFNRNIESLEFSNNINRQLDIVGAAVGTLQGAASGASSGVVAGGGAGALGAVIGGSLALGGGALDASLNESLRQEQLKLTRDLQRLNLGNIQAQPYSLAKTTPFTANNKIFPILEYYTCSPEEKALVEAFIENNSFNLGAVIPFKQLLTTRYNEKARQWIQGRVVEFPDNFGEDYHFAATLNRELAQGYSFKEYTEV